MVKTVLLAAILLAMTASPAIAQQVAPPDGAAFPRNESSLYSGPYEVTEDGDLIYGGDVGFECEDLVRMGAPAKPGTGDVVAGGGVVEPLTREAVELCAEAGFPPAGAVVGAPALSNAPDAAGGPDARRDDALPETGGPDPLALILAAVASLAVGAPLVFRAKR